MVEVQCFKLGLQLVGPFKNEIRYPMECCNGKKMSILRLSVFLQECVIMQEEVWWEINCVCVCLCAIMNVYDLCIWVHIWFSFMHDVCTSPQGRCAYCIRHKVTYSYSYSGQIYTSDQYACFLMMLQCCGWWWCANHMQRSPLSFHSPAIWSSY